MQLTIPRFFLNKPMQARHPHALAINQVWFQPMLVDLTGDALGLAMFSNRDAAQAYLDDNHLHSQWLITFFGYTELAALVTNCQSLGAAWVLRDPRATFSYAVESGRLAMLLSGEHDTGEDQSCEFELITAARLRPPA